MAVVVGDMGGCKEAFYAIQALEKKLGGNLGVNWIVDPADNAKAGVFLERQGVSYNRRLPLVEDNPDLLFVGTSATAVGAQVAWTKWARGKGTPVVWIEDFPGTGQYPSVRDVDPDVMVVTDEISAINCRKIRPSMKPESVVVCGKPSFPSEVSPLLANKVGIRREVRAKLGVTDGDLMIMVSPGVGMNIVEQLQAIAGIKNLCGRPVKFWVRLHPKMADGPRVAAWEVIHVMGDAAAASSAEPLLERLTVASDIVVATWGSTCTYSAAFAGIPPVLLLFPDVLEENQKRMDLGYDGGVPPLMQAGAAYAATGSGTLETNLRAIVSGYGRVSGTILNGSAAFRAMIEPGSADRVAAVLGGQLGL